MKKKEKTIYGLIGSILLLVLVVGTSYAYIKYDEKEAGYNVVGTNCIKITLKDKSTEINLKNAYPVEDEVGKTSKPYQFSITNECDVPVTYQVNLEVHQESSIDAGNIAVLFDNAEEKHILGTDDTANPIDAEDKSDIKESHKVGEGSVRGYETVYHEVRLWLDKNANNETQDKIFKCRVAIEAIQNPLATYREALLNGADPVLDTEGELIPVKIDESGIVTKADPSKEWYKYEKQQWANAVILSESGKAKTFAYDEVIPEEDIESYFVWIPKYSYRLFDMGNYPSVSTIEEKGSTTAIEIQFGLRNTIDSLTECETPMNEERTQGLSGESGNCTKGKLMTHPAFISFDVNGLWVGKFETGYKGATNSAAAQQNNNGREHIVIKPNQYSWNKITIGNSYTASLNYNQDLLSHNMKNTEWGAVAYLTQSIYGRCTNIGNITCSKVATNSNTSYVTGYSNTNIPYSDNRSIASSTTNNYSGIYDMNGGVWENQISVVKNQNNDIPIWGQSGLNKIEDKRFYDLYNYGTDPTHYERRILGDATGELGPFGSSEENHINSYFGSYSAFIYSDRTWFSRGAYAKLGENYSSIFSSFSWDGTINQDRGFRIVLAVR